MNDDARDMTTATCTGKFPFHVTLEEINTNELLKLEQWQGYRGSMYDSAEDILRPIDTWDEVAKAKDALTSGMLVSTCSGSLSFPVPDEEPNKK